MTRLNTFSRVIHHSGKFGASGHCLDFIRPKPNFSYRYLKIGAITETKQLDVKNKLSV